MLFFKKSDFLQSFKVLQCQIDKNKELLNELASVIRFHHENSFKTEIIGSKDANIIDSLKTCFREVDKKIEEINEIEIEKASIFRNDLEEKTQEMNKFQYRLLRMEAENEALKRCSNPTKEFNNKFTEVLEEKMYKQEYRCGNCNKNKDLYFEKHEKAPSSLYQDCFNGNIIMSLDGNRCNSCGLCCFVKLTT